ncbi:MAG: site-specific DNA-methyltransferase, partial [Candidatus Omnitrophica bacterium]|nr:site-specific DNA-methyltransferase [Candidatus Omnitrophota bacterium]
SCRILRIRGCSADAFFELVREFASEDLLYKIPSKHWPQGVAAKWPLKTYEAALLSTNLVNETKAKLRDWASLEDAERANFIEAFAQFWEKAGFPYHVPRPEELLTLSRLEASSVIQSGTIKARQVGQAICQGISRHIWAAHSYDSSSPLELFASKLRDLIEYCLKMGQVPNAANLRSALRFWRHNGVYNFRPSAAKALVDRYCRPGGVVFDPCAGYGGRLLGTLMSSAKATYVACEPLVESYKALGRLTEWISSYVSGVEYRVKLINQPAEEAQFPEDADVVLTSPPYWKREVYGDENTQSAVRYSTYEQWLTEFWLTTLKKAILALRPSGWLLLNVDNFSLNKRDYLLIQDTIKIVQSLGLGKYETLKYDMSGEGQGEVVLCWAKHVSAEVFSESYTDGVRLPTCSVCGKTKALKELFLGICDGCQTLPPTVTCEGCDVEFAQTWKGKRFHSEACYAQYRRRLSREQNPIKKGRTFTCKNCSSTWSTEKPGNFTICPTCREAKKAAIRRKVCAYRNCGIEFTDLSLKNSSKYCCPEHRRREKLFRSGIAQDGSYFRDSKPVNGGSRSAKR